MIAMPLAIAAFHDVPGVRIQTYPVAGSTMAAIRASLDAAELVDPNDASRVAGVTHWHFRWRWPGTAAGGCELAAASVRFRATVLLPRPVDLNAAAPGVQAAWAHYRAALEAHEANHVRYAYAHRSQVLAAIRGATCRTAQAAARRVVARLIAHDGAYDRATDHGAREGATFP